MLNEKDWNSFTLILTMALIHVYVHDMSPQFWKLIIPTYGFWFENFHNTCCNPWKEDPTPHFNQSHLTQPSNILMVRIELPIWFSIILLITTCMLNLQMDNATPIWITIFQELSIALKRVQFGKGFFFQNLPLNSNSQSENSFENVDTYFHTFVKLCFERWDIFLDYSSCHALTLVISPNPFMI